MTLINTTLGKIRPDDLGKVNVHEHVILDASQNPIIPEDFHHVDVGLIAGELSDWKRSGGGTIVDSSPISVGRNVDLLVQTSQNSAVPVIVSSGFHKKSYYTKDHWLFSSSKEQIAEVILGECTQGVLIDDQNPESSLRSEIKANILKIGADSEGISPLDSIIIQAVAETSIATNVPIMIHTEPGVPFNDLVAEIEKTNIEPSRIIICHMGKSLNIELHANLASMGFYLEFDEMIRPVPPLEDLAKSILYLFEIGYGDSILFAGDLARRSYWACYRGKPGLEYLVRGMDEDLRNLGFTQQMLEQIWVKNPLRFFS